MFKVILAGFAQMIGITLKAEKDNSEEMKAIEARLAAWRARRS